ncbi:Pick C1-like protein 1 [Seminavis robusta]|uniref:Pick C1-like protein 1 n=1 Tax=Seminavis robusta TaxID=568900 RepID=A0A9N8EE32_9STRA|nr:Pick C1-like protein 1 [Seminavis robusta]|eukprot:Sro1043_g234830.1 Pick C1-like protein 1 (980) ;mRNA; r:21321-24365
MCSADQDNQESEVGGCEKIGNWIDDLIRDVFYKIGKFVSFRPWTTIGLTMLIGIGFGGGFAVLESENRPEELWVPQNTLAEKEQEMYLNYFPPTTRINTMIISSKSPNNQKNVLTETTIQDALSLQQEIHTTPSNFNNDTFTANSTLVDLCTKAGGSCASSYDGVCQCLMSGILKMWNYDLETFNNDPDFMDTLNQYGSKEDLMAVLGNPTFDSSDQLVSAEAFTVTYFLDDRSYVQDGSTQDPINEQWEQDAFLDVIQKDPTPYTNVNIAYFSTRSFSDEFGGAITGDLNLVQISYLVTFVFLGATLGKIKCGPGSRWSMSIAAVAMIGLSTIAGFGLSALIGLFFGPVHSLLPFILLGIGVDDCFVIVNAFDRERKVPRKHEDDEALVERCARGLSRAGASITVTSMTDLVAFAISSTSALPALASFCAYASISITFLWFFASTFFTACLVLDERRQRGNRRDCFCCLTRGSGGNDNDNDNNDNELTEEDLNDNQEGIASTYFRKYHAPAILSKPGKAIVLLIFAGLLGFGIYGAINLSVENTERNFIPTDSYIIDYTDAADTWFSDDGTSVYFIFEETQANIGNGIYDKRVELADLDQRLTEKSTAPPYIAEPVSADAYRNVMTGLEEYLIAEGTDAIGNATLGADGWPTNQEDFVMTLENYVNFGAPGSQYSQDVAMVSDAETRETRLEAIRVEAEYVRLTKEKRGEVIEDSSKQIEAMDATRAMQESWTDLPPSFTYSNIFLAVEGFKVIQQELFSNVGLAIMSVAIIVLLTVGSFTTTILITLNVAFCIVEILGFMWAIGIAIDSVSVINIVLSVGLSVDYSAHVGHSFMLKGGNNWDRRVTETLADIGAAVLCGATSTFLAVAVLLGSSSYVFKVLSTQFALTVALGVSHGLVLLPVLMSLVGPKPFAAAEDLDAPVAGGKKEDNDDDVEITKKVDNASSEEDDASIPVPVMVEAEVPALTRVESDAKSIEV